MGKVLRDAALNWGWEGGRPPCLCFCPSLRHVLQCLLFQNMFPINFSHRRTPIKAFVSSRPFAYHAPALMTQAAWGLELLCKSLHDAAQGGHIHFNRAACNHMLAVVPASCQLVRTCRMYVPGVSCPILIAPSREKAQMCRFP